MEDKQAIKLAQELYFSAVEDGGGTFDYLARKFADNDGYVVGGKAPGLEIYVGDQGVIKSVGDIANWLQGTRSYFYGSWLSDDVLYIDAVDIFDDKQRAIEVGKLYNQQAIFDLASKEDIPLS